MTRCASRLVALLLLAPALGSAQSIDPTPDWVAVGTGQGDAAVLALSDAPDSGVYAAGRFRGEVVFGSFATAAPDTTTAAFLVALDATGAVRWLRGARARDGGRIVATGVSAVGDATGTSDVLVTGYTTTTASFDPGGGNSGALYVGAGGPHGFVARYSAAGVLRWVVGTGGPTLGAVWPARVAGVNGGALVVGTFSGSVTWDGYGGTVTRTAVGGTDGFAVRYRANGTLERIETVGGPADDALTDVVAVSYPDASWASGTFRGRIVVAGDTLDSRGAADAVAIRFGVDGAPTGTVQVGGPGEETGDGIHASQFTYPDIVTLAGTFQSDLPVGSDTLRSLGATDLFLVEVEANDRTVIRTWQAGGPGADRLRDVATVGAFYGDVFADAYLTAATVEDGSTLPFSPLYPPAPALPGFGGTDALAFTLAQYGDVFAGTVAGGAGTDRAFAVTGLYCYVPACPEAAVGGSFEGPAQFGARTVVGGPDADAFIAHYPQGALTPFYVASEPSPDASASLAVGPNPTRGSATVRLTLDAPAAVTVTVADALGRRVAALHDGDLAAGPAQWTLPAGLAPGVYVVRVTGGADASVRLVVTR